MTGRPDLRPRTDDQQADEAEAKKALAIAQATLTDMQRLIDQKEETVLKYQNLLEQLRTVRENVEEGERARRELFVLGYEKAEFESRNDDSGSAKATSPKDGRSVWETKAGCYGKRDHRSAT